MKNGVTLGNAPVMVHDIYNALATAPAGVKPRPKSTGSTEMVGIPVAAFITPTDESVAVSLVVNGWLLEPHVSKWTDPETGAVRPEQTGGLSFLLALPAGYELRKIPEPVPELLTPVDTELPGEVGWTANPTPGVIPELEEAAKLYPGIFDTDPGKHSEMMRALNDRKAAPPLGDN